MFTPKYLICLGTKAFLDAEAVCLGSQLCSLIEILSNLIKSHVWLCADVDAQSPLPRQLEINSFKLNFIGADEALINLCNNIDQFMSGVFIAIPASAKERFENSEVLVDTEDELYRPIDFDGILIEIRAFDTSYFKVYSENQSLMKQLSELFNSELKINE